MAIISIVILSQGRSGTEIEVMLFVSPDELSAPPSSLVT